MTITGAYYRLYPRIADEGADMIICTGGMSVDPDDKTPLAIRNSGAKVETYGAPVYREQCSCFPIIMRQFLYLDFRDA